MGTTCSSNRFKYPLDIDSPFHYCEPRKSPHVFSELDDVKSESSEEPKETDDDDSSDVPPTPLSEEDKRIAELVTEDLCSRGRHFYHGLAGVDVDYKEAFSLFRMAASRGSAQAEDMLGTCYYYGDGVEKDPKKAAEHFQNSAVKGYRGGMTHLGMVYEEGVGVRKNLTEALKWYQLGAEQGDKQAKAKTQQLLPSVQAADYYTQGKNYYFGLNNVSVDIAEAIKLFQQAAALGSAEADHKLAVCYYLGRGVPQDYREAVRHFRSAADKGLKCAMFQLAQCYENGQGVEKDWIGMLRWYSSAAAKGHKKALEKMKQLTPRKESSGTYRTL